MWKSMKLCLDYRECVGDLTLCGDSCFPGIGNTFQKKINQIQIDDHGEGTAASIDHRST